MTVTGQCDEIEVLVTVGVDTYSDVHVAVALDQTGRKLAAVSIPTTRTGYRRLLEWAHSFGTVARFGLEGTGSYGAGLTRFPRQAGIEVVEVIRPARQNRRLSGKNEVLDAEGAARSALAGTELGESKSQDGSVEMIRTMRVARRSAMKACTQAANQLRAVIVTAPDELRERLRGLPLDKLITTALRFRPGRPEDLEAASKLTLKCLATATSTWTMRSPHSTPRSSSWPATSRRP